MSIFGDLFGHDKKAARVTGAYVDPAPALPSAPPVPGAGLQGDVASGFTMPAAPPVQRVALPAAPPKRPGAFDKDHYEQTMLALAAGFFGSNGLGEGLSNAARVISGSNDAARRVDKPVIGGPDNSFEVYTDPATGEHTFKPIEAVQDYERQKAHKAKDSADINGRAMYAISQLPADQRAAAFADVRANPGHYGVDAESLPDHWDPLYGTIAGNMGMTVAQSQHQQAASASAAQREVHRNAADADRAARTQIYGGRAAAQTTQGAQRVGIAQQALGLRKGGGGGHAKAAPMSGMSTSDLLNIALGK